MAQEGRDLATGPPSVESFLLRGRGLVCAKCSTLRAGVQTPLLNKQVVTMDDWH